MVARPEQPSSPLATVLREVEAAYLRPNPERVEEVSKRADRLIQELHDGRGWMFKVVAVRHHGSIARDTALRGFNDLDRLVQLCPDALRTQAGTLRTARDTIQRNAGHIKERRAGLVSIGQMEVRVQNHSVGIGYAGGVRIDLVPAVEHEGRLLIPESRTNRWITTNPDDTAARLERAAAREPDTRAAIRILKAWSRARGWRCPLPSFAIETLVVDDIAKGRRSIDAIVESFFASIANVDARKRLVLGDPQLAQDATPVTVVDPVSKNNLTDALNMDQRRTLARSCRKAEIELNKIRNQAERGAHAQATRIARDYFVGRAHS